MEELLRYDHVDICYNGVPAVQDVSFALRPGEILGIVGESGCGKSTLLKAAMGLLGSSGMVTRGDIWYRDKNLPDLPARELRKLNGPELGMIFQSAGSSFCPIRTVGAQLFEAMTQHSSVTKKDFERRALELLEKLGFEDGRRALRSYPFELSGGMQQRVGIAAAMLQADTAFRWTETASGDCTCDGDRSEDSACRRADGCAGCLRAEAGAGRTAPAAQDLRNCHRAGCAQYWPHRRDGRPGAGHAGRKNCGVRRNAAGSAKSAGKLHAHAAGCRAAVKEGVKWSQFCVFKI